MSVISRHGGILLRHRLEDYTPVSIANNYVGLSIFFFLPENIAGEMRLG